MSQRLIFWKVLKRFRRKMKAKQVLFCGSALILLSMCFLLVHNAAIKPPQVSKALRVLPAIMPDSKKLDTPSLMGNRLKQVGYNKSVEGKNDEKLRFKSNANKKDKESKMDRLAEEVAQLEKEVKELQQEDTIRKPKVLPIIKADSQHIDDPVRKPKLMPIIKADNKIHGVVDAHRLSQNKFSIDELEPPDHLEAVKMEQDGHLNRDYKKEIFLGNHEELEKGTKEEIQDKLQEIFQKVDIDQDKRINMEELEAWILEKVEEHFDEAEEENKNLFKSLDKDRDGHLTWKEFHIEFLVALGNEEEDAIKHMEDYDTIALDSENKERLIKYKYKWAEADEAPQDNRLTPDEFKAFRHPEQSHTMLDKMVQDIIDNLDLNQDGNILEDEFVALPPGEVDNQFQDSDKAWQEERRKEFRNTIDINHDGQITRDELMNYVDPQNPNHAKVEARNLIDLGDTNHDGKLSLTEILDNIDLFLGSKMVNTGRSFHDEF